MDRQNKLTLNKTGSSSMTDFHWHLNAIEIIAYCYMIRQIKVTPINFVR